MIEREKVIKGLEICVDRVPGKYNCNECPYEIDGNYCEINLAKDAIALLKEQQQYIWELQDQVEYLTDKLKEQERIIKQYQKADGFLFAHGWKWEGR